MPTRPVKIKAVLLHFESIRHQPVLEMTAEYLRSKNVHLGLLCDQDHKSVQTDLKNMHSLNPSDIDTLITSDDLNSAKKDRNAITLATQTWGIDPERILLVSARPEDMQMATDAGAVAALWDPPENKRQPCETCDYRVSTPEALKNAIRMGMPLPAGKLPNDLLQEFLKEFQFDDPALLINPGIGEDIAAVDVDAEQVLVLKSDPITFATDAIGQYAVLINANDIATSGAVPRWLLTTLLFPYGVTPSEIRQVVNDLRKFCQRWRITLCGGHTEITDAVTRPVVIGMMAGSVRKSDLIDKSNMQTGDMVLFTKSVAVEGTAIIAPGILRPP